VFTADEHRGKGYATLVSAEVIKRCLGSGLSVFWSCETDNPASAAIARKLGFGEERSYPVYAYRSNKP
ncbi:GNAT family N-acetyltransferase, partial [Candidatus Bipolaricaulota bacterium]